MTIATVLFCIAIVSTTVAFYYGYKASRDFKAAKLYGKRADDARSKLNRLVKAFYFYDNKFCTHYRLQDQSYSIDQTSLFLFGLI
mgnify:CR=1 FL=1